MGATRALPRRLIDRRATGARLHEMRNFLKRAGDYARAAQEMGPPLFAAKALRKAGIRTEALRRIEVLGDKRQAQPGRLAKIYGDYERRAVCDFAWSPIDFKGKRVLEIGCGSLGGLAPLAIVEGAAGYVGIDPGFDGDVFSHPKMQKGFLPDTLSATANLRDEPDTPTVQDVMDRSVFLKTPLEKLQDKEPADIVVSISCLEHIRHFDKALEALKRFAHDGTRHFHVVNFGNHTNRAKPFDRMYDRSPKDYAKAFGRTINMLRAPDVEAKFKAAGFQVRLHPFDVQLQSVPPNVHPWWEEHYDRRALAVRTALAID